MQVTNLLRNGYLTTWPQCPAVPAEPMGPLLLALSHLSRLLWKMQAEFPLYFQVKPHCLMKQNIKKMASLLSIFSEEPPNLYFCNSQVSYLCDFLLLSQPCSGFVWKSPQYSYWFQAFPPQAREPWSVNNKVVQIKIHVQSKYSTYNRVCEK